MPSTHEAGLLPRRVAWVELLWPERCEVRHDVSAKFVAEIVLCRLKLRISIEEGKEARGLRVEAELMLTRLERDGGDGQRSGGAILDGDLYLSGGLQVSAQRRENR